MKRIAAALILTAALQAEAAMAENKEPADVLQELTNACGYIDTELLKEDLKTDYFEDQGLDSAKSAIEAMVDQYECEHRTLRKIIVTEE